MTNRSSLMCTIDIINGGNAHETGFVMYARLPLCTFL